MIKPLPKFPEGKSITTNSSINTLKLDMFLLPKIMMIGHKLKPIK